MDLLKSKTGRVLIESHRGAEGLAPENSWSALRAGAEAAADFLEIDVQLSRDGVAFLRHNYMLPDKRWCSEVPWAEIREIRIADELIPCLEDVLVWAKEQNVHLSLDVKVGFSTEGSVMKEVMRLLDRTNTEDRAMVLCWDHIELLQVKRIRPQIATRAHLRGRLADYDGFLITTRPNAVSLSYGILRPEDVDQSHRAGVAVMLGDMWFLDIETVKALDVDMITWSNPYEARKLLDQVQE